MKRPYNQGANNPGHPSPAVGHINPYVYGQQQPGAPAPPLPPGPPPPAAPAQAPNAYPGYNYPGYASAAPPQTAAHPQYPGYGYGGAAQQQQQQQQAYYGQASANSPYAAGQNAAAYAAYYGTQPQASQQYAGYLPPAQQQQAHPAPPYGGPAYNTVPGPAGFPAQSGLSPQGAPPYKRTRYDSMSGGGGPQPPTAAGPLPPPPPALPPVGGRAGPPMRGPPTDAYDGPDRYRAPQHSPRSGSSYGGRDRYGGPSGPSGGGGRPPRGRDAFDSRSMPPPSGGRPPFRAPPPATSGPLYGSSAPRGARGPPGGRHERDRGSRAAGPRDGYRDSRRDDRGRSSASTAGGGKGPRSAVNRKEPRRERKWGSKDGKDVQTSNKDESKTFLTDFRISSLSIADLDWDWTTEQESAADTSNDQNGKDPTKSTDASATPDVVDTAADMSVDTIAPVEDADGKAESDATASGAPAKKPSKRQRRAAAKRAAAAAKAEAEEAKTADVKEEEAVGDTGEVQENEDAAGAPFKKDGKHGRDEDGDGEADTEVGVVATKKVKADSGEAVTLLNVDVMAEASDAAANATKKAENPVSVVEQDQEGQKALSATNIAQRENSRLRIYFSSPVSSPPTYAQSHAANEGDKRSVAASDVEADGAKSSDALKPELTEANSEIASNEVLGDESPSANALQTGPDKAEDTTQSNAVVNEEKEDASIGAAEVDGEPLDGEPMSDLRNAPGDDEDESDGESLNVESTLVVSSSAPVIESDNSSYPPDPYSQGAQPSMSREHSLAPTDTAHHHPPEPSADRISISYARNTRRIVIDAHVVDKVLIYRAEGRVELSVQLKPAVNATDPSTPDEFRIEAHDPDSDDFYVIDRFSLEHAWLKQESGGPEETGDAVVDALLPPLHRLLKGAAEGDEQAKDTSLFKQQQIKIVAYLDRANPLTEARWVKTGEVEQWIISLGLTNGQDPRKDKLSEWRGKIVVVDPDAPPTIEHTLKSWVTSSTVGNFDERKKFVETHMADIDNVVEILLRLTRGDRSGPSYSNAASSSQANSVGVLAATLSAPYPDSQTQVSLAVLAMFRLSVETAERAGLDKQEVHKQVSEIIRNVPFQLQHKALDGMFKEFRSSGKT
ncbi:hypothetical protein OIV83_006188 [Microbotryomycetes sp. JL201]|nr:hypothetical protein OIV83_006188 [Microbotryomycetes sp. JL201]